MFNKLTFCLSRALNNKKFFLIGKLYRKYIFFYAVLNVEKILSLFGARYWLSSFLNFIQSIRRMIVRVLKQLLLILEKSHSFAYLFQRRFRKLGNSLTELNTKKFIQQTFLLSKFLEIKVKTFS